MRIDPSGDFALGGQSLSISGTDTGVGGAFFGLECFTMVDDANQ